MGAVGVADAVFGDKMRRASGEMALDPGFQARAILGVNAIEPILRAIPHPAVVVAERFLPPGRIEDLAGDEIPVPEAVVGAAGRELIALLAAPQGLRARRHDLFEVVRMIDELVLE